ncbi:MAG: serine/threonine protein kinase [Phycisphaeraceae bacterium]|nr:MAG: serine/threonine protein kinase [Phycisphaeraceae bacterium]
MISRARDFEFPVEKDDFASMVADLGEVTDSSLAYVIERHARWMMDSDQRVTLDAYLEHMNPASAYPISLDAAVEYTLRSSGGGCVDELMERYPDLSDLIRESALLNQAIDDLDTIPGRGEPFEPPGFPIDFGPACYCREKQYTLLGKVGQGTSGAVFRAVDHVLSDAAADELVAVKILHRTAATDEQQRRLEEAFKARFVKHENVVRVLSCGVQEGFPFIVFELVDGKSLWEVGQERRFTARDGARLMLDAANGVLAAHTAGVAHMDLKPQNILLNAEDRALVTDFGIAVSTGDVGDGAGRFRGTVAFMAPEQFVGGSGQYSQASDLFALGTILIWLLTGEIATLRDGRRLLGQSLDERLDELCKRIEREHGRDVGAICRRAAALDVSSRYSSAHEFAHDLRCWLEHRPLVWTKPNLLRRALLWRRRRPGLAVFLLVIFVLAIGAVSYMGYATVRWNMSERGRLNAVDNNWVLLYMLSEVQTAISKMQDADRAGEFLLYLWAFEWVAGERLIGNPDYFNDIWASRITIVEQILKDLERRDMVDTDEYRLWSRALTHWNAKLASAIESQMHEAFSDSVWTGGKAQPRFLPMSEKPAFTGSR